MMRDNMLRHDQSCKIKNLANDVEADAEVTGFEPQQHLRVVMAGNRITMNYNKITQEYVGSTLGMDFVSEGPKYYNVKQGRY